MSKRSIALAASALFILAGLAACGPGEKEKQKLDQAHEWEISNLYEGPTPPPKPAPLPKDLVIEVPESVKAKYKAVVMGVGNRKTKEIRKFTVALGETAKVPGTEFTLKVGEYLPNWTVRGRTVSSRDDNPDDPAVRATIYEKDKVVFDGFIFQKHKTPSFMTDDYVVGLLDAVSR